MGRWAQAQRRTGGAVRPPDPVDHADCEQVEGGVNVSWLRTYVPDRFEVHVWNEASWPGDLVVTEVPGTNDSVFIPLTMGDGLEWAARVGGVTSGSAYRLHDTASHFWEA